MDQITRKPSDSQLDALGHLSPNEIQLQFKSLPNNMLVEQIIKGMSEEN